MNREIKKEISALVEPLGFVYKDHTFVRVVNDVLQGCSFRERKRTIYTQRERGIYTNLELYFRIFPLCCSEARVFTPDLPFDHSSFQDHRIGDLQPQMSVWPYIYQGQDGNSIADCAQKICIDVDQFLLPFFQSCDSCCHVFKQYPKNKWYSDFNQEWLYFSLKADHPEIAINLLQRHIQKREASLKINLQSISEYDKSPAFRNAKEWNRKDQEQLDFLMNATKDEIQKYLLEKEKTACQALQTILPQMKIER